MNYSVELTTAEMTSAAMIGVFRHAQAIQRGLPDRHGFEGKEKGWHIHIEGACGEMAVAKVLGTYWSVSVGTFKSGGDVGALQVRTRSRDDYELIVRPNDKPDAVYVLVTGCAPKFKIVGWMRGFDAMKAKYCAEHGGRSPAWFVPQADLRDIAELRNESDQHRMAS